MIICCVIDDLNYLLVIIGEYIKFFTDIATWHLTSFCFLFLILMLVWIGKLFLEQHC